MPLFSDDDSRVPEPDTNTAPEQTSTVVATVAKTKPDEQKQQQQQQQPNGDVSSEVTSLHQKFLKSSSCNRYETVDK